MNSREPDSDRTGATEFAVSYRLTWAAWAALAFLQAALFLRPSPYGGPYVTHWDRYLFHALFYEVLGVFLPAAPFLFAWLVLYQRERIGRAAVWSHAAQLAVFCVIIIFSQFDHEIMRFVGWHVDLTFLKTYFRLHAGLGTFGDAVWNDPGGPWSCYILAVLALAFFLPWAYSIIKRASMFKIAFLQNRTAAVFLAALPLIVTSTAYYLPGGKFRLRRVQPFVVGLLKDAFSGFEGTPKPENLDELVSEYRSAWLKEECTGNWRFKEKNYPYFKEPASAGVSSWTEKKWNVLYIQLETMRAWDVGFIGGKGRGRSPTPFMDSLAYSPESAYWTRFFSFGPPTINAFLSVHCSLKPHSRRHVTTSYPYLHVSSLPSILRKHGYTAEFFTGSDPDWDNETIWLKKWYDRYWFYREADEKDLKVFEEVRKRLLHLGATGKPFFATVVSITNHYPFKSRDPGADVFPGNSIIDRMHNTMYYTDRAVRELIEGIAGEPWFEHTLIVITGDHGYSLGEHGGSPGLYNAHRESNWVPLLIHGNHPRLPKGSINTPACHLDIAPTVLDLLDIEVPNSFMGHSLVRRAAADAGSDRIITGSRNMLDFAETRNYSLAYDPDSNGYRLYDSRSDPFQQHDISASHPDVVELLEKRVQSERILNDYLIERNLILPHGFDSD